MIKFAIFGVPIAQGRPKFSTKGGFVRAYDPAKSRNYKSYVQKIAYQHKPDKLLDGPIELTLITYREIPKSFSKKKRIAAENGEIRPITKPDIENYVKGVMDAMSGVIWTDDSRVVDLYTRKFYSENPRVEVAIQTLGGERE